MTDRELLELAAKAVGMVVLPDTKPWPRDLDGWFFNQVGKEPPALYDRSKAWLPQWAPLTDDADAFRLAVKLRISLIIGEGSTLAADPTDYNEGIREKHGIDPAAAARRAIVRAAAEIAARL
jgi:hypothetical protein